MLKMETTTTLSGWGRIECKRADLERNVTFFRRSFLLVRIHYQ